MANVEDLAFLPGSGNKVRTLKEWTGDVVNVRDFGALGDDGNDTTALQRAFDTAFGGPLAQGGRSTTPNGAANAHLNRKVYFPAGRYRVAGVTKSITSAVFTSGIIRYTCNSHGFLNNDLIFITGVTTGTPANDDVWNGTRKITNVTTNTFDTANTGLSPIGSGTGGTADRPGVTITDVVGGIIEGLGNSSEIMCSAGYAIGINGMRNTVFRNLGFDHSGAGFPQGKGSIILDRDAGPGTIDAIKIRSVAFRDCVFVWPTDACVHIAPTSGSGGDTCSFWNCIFQGDSSLANNKGVWIGRYNTEALNCSVFECNAIQVGYGIYCDKGTIGAVVGLLCEHTQSWDIFATGANTAAHTPVIAGCGIEGGDVGAEAGLSHFCNFTNANATLIGCNVRDYNTNSVFLRTNRPANILGCVSYNGEVRMEAGGTVRSSYFGHNRPFRRNADCPLPVHIENCMVRGTPWYPGSGGQVFSTTHVSGFFINDTAGTTQYFVGEKRRVQSVDTTVVSDVMKVGDLPPIGTPYTDGIIVAVHDSALTNGSTKGTNVLTAGTGPNTILCINTGPTGQWQLV